MLLILAVSTAHAASVTELPPFLRGDAKIGYTFDRLAGALTEVDYTDDPARTEVGQRELVAHHLRYGVLFSVYHGVALELDIEHDAAWSVSYDQWHGMVYEPSTGSGTMIGTGVEDRATPEQGGGIAGVWIGVEGTPFSSAFKSRPSRVTWLLEGAVRPPAASNAWTFTETSSDGVGQRGAGPGGLGLRLRTAWSLKTKGAWEPYLQASFVREGEAEVKLTDDAGEVLKSSATVDPGDSMAVRFGGEATLGQNDAAGSRFGLDLHAAFAYTSAGMVPTEVYLPSVLVPDQGVVQTAEAMELGAGLGLGVRPFKYLEIGARFDAMYHFPQRIEIPYPVYTGGSSFRLAGGVDLTVRIR